MSFLFLEQVEVVPMFIGESPVEPFYVLPGENLTVIANVVMFDTTHIQLLKHVYNNQTDKNVTEPFKVLNIQREDVPVIREATNGGAKEYLMKYYFINITEADLGVYSIMAGNRLGFNTYDFEIAWQEPGLWHSFKITPQFLSLRDIEIMIESNHCGVTAVVNSNVSLQAVKHSGGTICSHGVLVFILKMVSHYGPAVSRKIILTTCYIYSP